MEARYWKRYRCLPPPNYLVCLGFFARVRNKRHSAKVAMNIFPSPIRMTMFATVAQGSTVNEARVKILPMKAQIKCTEGRYDARSATRFSRASRTICCALCSRDGGPRYPRDFQLGHQNRPEERLFKFARRANSPRPSVCLRPKAPRCPPPYNGVADKPSAPASHAVHFRHKKERTCLVMKWKIRQLSAFPSAKSAEEFSKVPRKITR